MDYSKVETIMTWPTPQNVKTVHSFMGLEAYYRRFVEMFSHISNPITDVRAQLPSTGQSAMNTLWQTTANGQQPLRDGQVLYLAEGFFETPAFSLGYFQSTGVYSRFFF